MRFNYCPQCGKHKTVQQKTDTLYKCSSCKFEYWNNPRTTVAVVFIKGKQALFAKRGIEPNKGQYDFPGGFLEYNEDIYEACVREVREESGVTIKPQDLRLVNGYILEYLPGTSVTDLVFTITKWQGEFVAKDDVAAFEWKPLDFMKDKQFVPNYPGLASKLLPD